MDWMINAFFAVGALLGVAAMLVLLCAMIEEADEMKEEKKWRH